MRTLSKDCRDAGFVIGLVFLLAMLATMLGCVEKPRPHLYVFGAQWCHTCQQDVPRINDIVKLGRVTVHYYDVDRDAAFARPFGVTDVPAYILYSDDIYNGGKERWRVNSAHNAYHKIVRGQF